MSIWTGKVVVTVPAVLVPTAVVVARYDVPLADEMENVPGVFPDPVDIVMLPPVPEE